MGRKSNKARVRKERAKRRERRQPSSHGVGGLAGPPAGPAQADTIVGKVEALQRTADLGEKTRSAEGGSAPPHYQGGQNAKRVSERFMLTRWSMLTGNAMFTSRMSPDRRKMDTFRRRNWPSGGHARRRVFGGSPGEQGCTPISSVKAGTEWSGTRGRRWPRSKRTDGNG